MGVCVEMNKRQAQARKTKKRIYNTSLTLMAKNGFENVTISDISKKAGVSVGSFYRYYKSKEDMFFEIYRDIDEHFENEVAPELLESGLSAPGQIVEFFRRYAAYVAGRELEITCQLYNTNNKLFIDKDRYMLVLLKKIIHSGYEKGELPDTLSPDEIMVYCLTVARGVVFDWCLNQGNYSLEDRMTGFCKWFFDALMRKQ